MNFKNQTNNTMKNLYSLFLLTILSTTLFAQTTRRVNGDSDITGVNVYNTIQAAVDAANTDDIILIEPYGKNSSLNPTYNEDVLVDKRLHFRGNGYNLTNPSLGIDVLDKRDVNISGIQFQLGSSSSTMKNLVVNTVYFTAPNILAESSKIGILYFSSLENSTVIISEGVGAKIRKCLITGGIFDARSTLSFNNNNLNFVAENSRTSYISSVNNSIFKNCLINSMGSSNNSIFTNCIFQNAVVGLPAGSNYNNAISYCISFAGDLPTIANNIINVAWQQVFSGPYYIGVDFNAENDLVLSGSSVAKNAGINGGDIGVYGGTYPYELSGLPHHPISTFFINSGIGNNNIDIDAVITIKAN